MAGQKKSKNDPNARNAKATAVPEEINAFGKHILGIATMPVVRDYVEKSLAKIKGLEEENEKLQADKKDLLAKEEFSRAEAVDLHNKITDMKDKIQKLQTED